MMTFLGAGGVPALGQRGAARTVLWRALGLSPPACGTSQLEPLKVHEGKPNQSIMCKCNLPNTFSFPKPQCAFNLLYENLG